MGESRLAIIRVMTLSDQDNSDFSDWLEKQFPFLAIQSFAIADQPDGVHDMSSFRRAQPKVVRMIQQLSSKDFQGFFVNCAEDPGVEDARRKTSVPVWGAGSTAACIARSTGLPIGVISLTKEIPPVIAHILDTQLVYSAVPTGVSTALDLSAAADGIVDAAHTCVLQGARAILLACTGMSLLGTADHLRENLAIPIIDPLLAPLAAIEQVFKTFPVYPAIGSE